MDEPAALRARGGAWSRGHEDDDGSVAVEIHVGVEGPSAPARNAPLALLLQDADDLEPLGQRLTVLGVEVDWSERTTFDGFHRFHTSDGHGNRIEVPPRCRSKTPAPPRRHRSAVTSRRWQISGGIAEVADQPVATKTQKVWPSGSA